MIAPVIDFLNALINTQGFTCNGITRLLERDDKTFPGVYEKAGKFSKVNLEKSLVYHRVLSRTTEREEGMTAKEDIVTRTWGMKLVCSFDRKDYGDSGDSEDEVATVLIGILEQTNIKTLASQFGMIEVSTASGVVEEGRTVWGVEFAGIDYRDGGLISVEYELKLRGPESCFAACGDIDVKQAIIDGYCPAALGATVNVNSTLYAAVADGGTENVLVRNSADTEIGTVTAGVEVDIADMSLVSLDDTSQAVVVIPGGTITAPGTMIIVAAAGETTITLTLGAEISTATVTAEAVTNINAGWGVTINGGGSVGTLVAVVLDNGDALVFTIVPTAPASETRIELTF